MLPHSRTHGAQCSTDAASFTTGLSSPASPPSAGALSATSAVGEPLNATRPPGSHARRQGTSMPTSAHRSPPPRNPETPTPRFPTRRGKPQAPPFQKQRRAPRALPTDTIRMALSGAAPSPHPPSPPPTVPPPAPLPPPPNASPKSLSSSPRDLPNTRTTAASLRLSPASAASVTDVGWGPVSSLAFIGIYRRLKW